MEKMVTSIAQQRQFPNPHFWLGKRVLVTGHTGFKGGWLCLWLHSLGAKICGLSLDPPTSPNFFELVKLQDLMQSVIGDIRHPTTVSQVIKQFQPEVIFHLAAQPLVLNSYRDPVLTYETNIMGTVNLLEAVRTSASNQVVINITSDKCYQDRNDGLAYKEDDPMGGNDPYSSSKGCSELITAAYRHSFINKLGIGLATARAGNVIGGGDWAEDRLVPDTLKAFEAKRPVFIRHPNAVRPWQHVLDPICGYIILGEALWGDRPRYSRGWNFGPTQSSLKTVGWIVSRLCLDWGVDATWALDEANEYPHESHTLRLDPSMTSRELNWQIMWGIEETIDKTVEWHRSWRLGENCRDKSFSQINEYSETMLT
jgi:CDP-glucose 4,6-dehydratase